jgi:hypothetical protein
MKTSMIGLAAIAAAASVSSATITFEGLTIGPVGGDLVQVDEGITVTISGPGLTVRDFNFPPFPRSNVIHVGDFGSPMQIDLTAGVRGLTFENYIYGFYTDEVDTFVVEAYDADNNLIDTFSGGGQFISVTAGIGEADIAKVIIDDQNTGYQIDNIELDVIPSPASLLVLAPLALARRRR